MDKALDEPQLAYYTEEVIKQANHIENRRYFKRKRQVLESNWPSGSLSSKNEDFYDKFSSSCTVEFSPSHYGSKSANNQPFLTRVDYGKDIAERSHLNDTFTDYHQKRLH